MLTEQERKEIGRIPFIAHRRRSRLSFMPILIAFFAMSTILCLLSVIFHATMPESGVRTQSSSPPKNADSMTRIAGDLPKASPLLFPVIENH